MRQHIPTDVHAFLFSGAEQIHIPAVYETDLGLKLYRSGGEPIQLLESTADVEDKGNLVTGVLVKPLEDITDVAGLEDDDFGVGDFTFD